MKNMTELIQDHTENLEQASFTAYNIHDSLEKAAALANAWNETLLGGSLGDNAIRIAGPLTTVFLGNYGLAPSLARNVLLVVSGYGFAETIVQWRHLECDWSWPEWIPTSRYAASMTQLPHLTVHDFHYHGSPKNGNFSV